MAVLRSKQTVETMASAKLPVVAADAMKTFVEPVALEIETPTVLAKLACTGHAPLQHQTASTQEMVGWMQQAFGF